jgi:predicted PurR-regulated permease PerM
VTTPVRVRLTPASALRTAVVAVGALAALVALDRARTVLHWLITAGAAAMLLDGAVRGLVARRVPRWLAVTVVTVLTLTGAALLTYGVVDSVVDQYARLRDTAPAAVADLLRSTPLDDVGARTRLVQRTQDLVDQAPTRLFGSPVSAARTAAGRLGEVALVLTLTVFMLVAYEAFEERLARTQDASRHDRWSGVDAGVTQGARAARHVVLRVLALGVVTAVLALLAQVPAPVVLGLWAAWWRLLPVLGLVVAHAPLVLLLVTGSSAPVAVVAIAVLVLVEAATTSLVRRARDPVEPPMAFLSAVFFSGGFELGGVVGAVVAVVLVHLLVGVLQAVLTVAEPEQEPVAEPPDPTAAPGQEAKTGTGPRTVSRT